MRGRSSPAWLGWAGLCVGLVAISCEVEAPAFVCSTNAECNLAGFCEAQGVCSTMDVSCPPSMRRYAPTAGNLAGQCVLGEPVDPTGPVPEDGGPCTEAGDCDDGFCESSGWCSFPESDCDSARIYGKSDDAALQGECVAPHECNATLTDTFQDGAIDDKVWDTFAYGGAEESWIDVGASAVRFRFPVGSFEENRVVLETVDVANMTASEVIVRVTTPPSEDFLVDMTVYNTTLNGTGLAEEVYAVMYSDRIVFGVGLEVTDVRVDYETTEYVGLMIKTSEAALVGGSDKDDLDELESFEHELDLSRARVYFQAAIPVTGVTEELRRAEFGSIKICSIE